MKTIAGKDYDYTKCPRCEVFILTRDFESNPHKDCDRYHKGLQIRKNAENRALGKT